MKRVKIYSKIARFKELLNYFIKKYCPTCYFCGEYITFKDVLLNKWTIHHQDENRGNNFPENLELSHRSCHRSYHRKLEEEERRKRYEKI